ncbi:MAG: MMPL family transporter [Planctomycetota bacterium]|jgi:hopanoid biosynthesis associated RND transporter like protein HpnN
MLSRFRHKVLTRWSHIICDHPVTVLLASVLLAVLSIVYTVTQLGFQADRNDLISPDLDWNQRYIRYLDEFQGYDSIAVIVRVPEGDDGPGQAQAFVREVVERLNQRPEYFKNVWWGIDPAEASAALMRLQPMDEFRSNLGLIAEAAPLLQAQNVAGLLGQIPAQLTQQTGEETSPEQAAEMIDQLSGLIGAVDAGLRGELSPEALAQLSPVAIPSWEFLESDDGRLLFIDMEPKKIPLPQYPGVEAGLTGIPVIEADETLMSMTDSTICSIIAVSAISVLLVVSFGSWRLPLVMVLALGLGVAWSFGFLTLSIGHLQVLSVVFTVILLGLGIDFGIHLISRYELIRADYPAGPEGFRLAMTRTLQSTGPGMFTGAVTTALAFSTTTLTDFTGMAEMGLIAGVGVMLCLLAMMTALPAIMRLVQHEATHVKMNAHEDLAYRIQRGLTPLFNRPKTVCLIGTVVFGVACVLAMEVRYNNNLLDLLPTNLKSVQWQQEVLDHTDQAILYGVSSTDTLDEARQRADELRRLSEVASVGGVGLFYPEDEDAKIALIEHVRGDLSEQLNAPASGMTPDTAPQLAQAFRALTFAVGFALQRQDVKSEPVVHEALSGLLVRLNEASKRLADPDFTANAQERLAGLTQAFDQMRGQVRELIEQALAPRRLQPDDLPRILQREAMSLGEPTRYQLKIYPVGNVWDPDQMKPFMEQVQTIDPMVTGSPVQIYLSGLLMRDSYYRAGALAVIAVLLLAFVDFWKIVDALLCLLPVVVGFVCSFAVMYLVGVSVNPANIIVLPLMFGIGVASGVHIMHRYRQEPAEEPVGLAHGTGKGIMLTSATTIIAFSSMLLAQHRGIQSLGFVLAMGITLTLVASMTLMPAVLQVRNGIRRGKGDNLSSGGGGLVDEVLSEAE